MTKRTFEEALRLFNEKVTVVQSRSFTTRLFAQGGFEFEISASVDKPGVTFQSNAPNEEAFEATTVTCRFFLEPRDGCSFEQLAVMYADPANGVDPVYQKHFNDFTSVLNTELESVSSIEGMKTRDLLYTVVYGEIAHSNPEKQAIVRQWKEAGFFFYLAYGQAMCAMAHVIAAAINVSQVNERILSLRAGTTS